MRDCAGAVEAPADLVARGAHRGANQGGAHGAAEGGIAGGCSDASTVDVLVITTPGARTQAGGAGQLGALVDLAEASANAAYSNSAIAPRIRVVFDMEVQYTEVGFSADLSSLASGSDGVLDEIHQLRDAAGADLVAMVRTSGEYCGIAYLMPSNDPSVSGIGFSVTAWSCMSSQTFAHELGHNMGCCHAPNDGGGCTTGGIFAHSVGHRFTGTSGTTYRTVMAYSPGSRIDHFSNPLVNFNGTPTGVAPVGGDAGRDNASSLVTTNAAVRGFRCAAPPGAFGDCDQDGRIDITQLADGSASDCDGNGALDRCDLASSTLCAIESRFLCAGGVVTGAPPQLALTDNFYGYSVDTDSRTVVVGAYGDDVGGSFAGSATVFSITGSTVQFVATLRHANPHAMDLFGRAVAVDGSTIAVGSETRDVGAFNGAGDVCIYNKSATGAPWQLVATLTAPVPIEAGRFGAAVALRGDVLVVGAPEYAVTTGPAQRGHAYIYERVGAIWQLVKTLAPLDATNQGNFGLAVAVAQGVAVVGAPYVALPTGEEPGAVYYSMRGASTWADAVRLQGLPQFAGRSGTAVATDGIRIAVGSPGAGAQSSLNGSAVHMFDWSGSAWQLSQTIESASSIDTGKFGSRVALDGDNLLVGSWPTADTSGFHESFGRTGQVWESRGPIRVGFAVAVRGEHSAIGSYRDMRAGVPSGDARVEIRLEDVDSDNKADRCERARGDLDLNGAIDGLDLAKMLAAWGTSDVQSDVDASGVVDGSDLAALLAGWGAL